MSPRPVDRRLGVDATPGAIPALDGIRAIAIVLVVARHGIRPFWGDAGPEGASPWLLAVPAVNGWMGVDLFFVLSGFLICRHLLHRRDTGRTGVGSYFAGRALRILPAYLVVVAVVALGLVPSFEVVSTDVVRSVGVHLLFLQDLLGADLVVVLWSLGVEEKFYVAAPLLVLAVARLARPRDRFLVLALVAAVPLLLRAVLAASGAGPATYQAWFTDLRSPFFLTFDGLAVGVLCAFVHHHRDELRWASGRTGRRLYRLGGAGFALALVAGPWLDRIDAFDRVGLQAVLAVLAGAVVLGAALGGARSPAMWAPWTVVAARLSYSWYLVHVLTIPLALELTAAVRPGPFALDPLALAVFAPVYLALSLGAAVALHRLVEQPFLARRDQLLARWDRQRLTCTTATSSA